MARFDNKNSKKITMPAAYRIEIQGHLDRKWSERLSGMDIEPQQKDDEVTTTILKGRVRDQAELSGILNTLYEMHLVLLKVEIQSEQPPGCE